MLKESQETGKEDRWLACNGFVNLQTSSLAAVQCAEGWTRSVTDIPRQSETVYPRLFLQSLQQNYVLTVIRLSLASCYF